MRNGPHPLSVHLGIAASNMARMHEYASAVNATQYNHDDLVETVRGIQMYQNHPYARTSMDYEIIYQREELRILKPLGQKKIANSVPLILVPSLINRSSILDINAEMSFLRWLSAKNINAYLLDWGNISANDADMSMHHVVQEMLLDGVSAVSKINHSSVNLIGYCMGGVLCAGLCAIRPDLINRMVLLATPWDFQDDKNILAKHVRIWSNYIDPIMSERGYIPSEWIQALFAGYDPDGAVQKFARFASMNQGSAEANLFVAVEDWLNEGVDLPANIARHCMQNWFKDNVLLNNSWVLENEYNVDLKSINKDILIVASDKDRLVPYSCAIRAKETLQNANVDILKKSSGHIGLIVGKKAVNDVWIPIYQWLEK